MIDSRAVFFVVLSALSVPAMQAAAAEIVYDRTWIYEFDVVASNPTLSFSDDGRITNLDTNEVVAEEFLPPDSELLEALISAIHPLSSTLGKTGRHVIEITGASGIDGNAISEDPMIMCQSGFLCENDLLFQDGDFTYEFGLSENGFYLNDLDIDWRASWDSFGNGFLRFVSDEPPSYFVTIDGVSYQARPDWNGGVSAAFEIANAKGIQILPAVPLPSSALLLVAGLGGSVLLHRRK